MKNSTFLRSLLTLLVMVAWGGAMAQTTYTHTFKSGDLGTGQNVSTSPAGSKTLSDCEWEFNITKKNAYYYLGWDSAKGVQIGSSKQPATEISLSTSEIPGTITSIVVNTSGASSITATVNVSVGGTVFSPSSVSLTSTATAYTFEGSAEGEVVLSWANTSSKAIYIKSISITYTTSSSVTPTAAAPTFTPDGGTVEKGSTVSLACGTEGATIYYAIDAADPETAVGTSYTTPIAINEDCSITAWAEADGMDASARVTKTFETAKKNQTLIFSETNISINEGETLTKPTLSGNETTVTYSSSNTSVATVDKNTGDVTIVGTGTTIITATAEGTNEYYEASAQYTLTVIADPSNGGTATFDFTDPVSLGLAVPAVGNETIIDNAVISGAVTMTATHGSSTKTRIYNSSGKMDLRIYKNGGSITFAVPDGYEITSITYTGEAKPTNWIGSAQSVTVTANTTLRISTATITYARVYPLNISAAGYATFTSDKNYIIPAGVEGGIVTVEGTTANVNYVYTEGDIVPANTGLLMKGAQGEYKMYATTQEATEVYAENLLKGALTNDVITAPANTLLYIFANDSESGLGFYWQKDSGNGQQVKNMAGKAYLQAPTTSPVQGFRLNLGDTTGITAVESTNANAPVYTLSGVRVNGSINNLPAGIYIVGGKKVYVK